MKLYKFEDFSWRLWLTSHENQESRMFPRNKNEQNIQKYTDDSVFTNCNKESHILFIEKTANWNSGTKNKQK